jgi:prepilin-type N-terminal cleavage/methylation domain-containing protein
MAKRAHGFTIVEVLVVVAIIGILATITSIGFNRYQTDARDNARYSKVTILAEALEKYYDNNGEYPSCSAISGAASTVTTSVLPGVEMNTLLTPQSAAGDTNSIKCIDLTGVAGEADIFAYYPADRSLSCSGSQSCLDFILKYKEESSNQIKAIASRRTAIISSSEATTVTVTSVDFSQIALSWTPVGNAVDYTLQQATNSDFTANLVESNLLTTSATASSLDSGTLYYFRVVANFSIEAGNWSTAVNATTWTDPAAPTISADLSGVNVLATISPVTCHAGTIAQYGIRSRINDGTWGAYSAWSTTTTASQAAAQGTKYGYQAQVRCYSVDSTSSTITGLEATYIRPISTPAAPVLGTPSTVGSTTTYPWSAVSCTAGTTVRYQYRYVIDFSGGYVSGWYGPTANIYSLLSTTNEGYQYTAEVQAQCYTTNIASAWSSSGQASYIRPVLSPGSVNFAIHRVAANDLDLEATSTCTGGTYLYSRIDARTWDYVWADTLTYGWWADSHSGIWIGNTFAYHSSTIVLGIPLSVGTYSDGARFNMAVELRCQNVATSRTSGSTGRIESGLLILGPSS